MTDTPAAQPPGRPTKYDPSFPDLAYKLCLLMGATDRDLADFFEVSESTINLWKLEHPEFSESVKSGKKIADMHIAQKLLNRAEGAEWVEDQAIKVKTVEYNEAGKKVREVEEVQVVPVRKAAALDTTALIFWLKNRQPKNWRDKQDHELTGKDGAPLSALSTLSPETLYELLTISEQLTSGTVGSAGEPGDPSA